jgi:hypothetical protein
MNTVIDYRAVVQRDILLPEGGSRNSPQNRHLILTNTPKFLATTLEKLHVNDNQPC